jgi:hypothetical protein
LADARIDLALLSPGERALLRALSGIEARLSRLEEAVRSGQSFKVGKGRSENAPITVALDLRDVGATTLEVTVRSDVACVFLVEGSVDGVNFAVKDRLVLASPGEIHQGYANAYPVVRVRSDDAGNHEVEVVAAR